MSGEVTDSLLDKEIEKGEIAKCLRNLKNSKTGGIKHGDSSSASFMAFVEECISERESRQFEEGLNTKVK